jgi:hypothetical protein
VEESSDLAGWEPAEDVLAFLQLTDRPLARDQLARLHKRGLIDRPRTRYRTGRRGLQTLYPPGTTHTVCRIVELRQERKLLEEVAWIMWWNNERIGMAPVRAYVLKVASRYDKKLASATEQIDEIRSAPPGSPEYKRFEKRFRDPDAPTGMGSMRRRLGRRSSAYEALINLAFDAIQGTRSFTNDDAELLERALGFSEAKTTPLQGESGWYSGMNASSIQQMSDFLSVGFEERAQSLSDDQLLATRDFLELTVSYISTLGLAMHTAFGGSGLGFQLAGKHLAQLASTPEGQAVSVVLFSALLADPIIQANRTEFERGAEMWQDEGFRKFQAMQALRAEIPSLAKVVTHARLAAAFKSKQGQVRLETVIRSFREEDGNAELLDAAIARHPDLFVETTAAKGDQT